MIQKERRDINLDFIRVVAVFFVVSSHFLLRSGFYDELVAGKRMYVMVVMRYLFMSCVPLFLILTGYLCGSKKPTGAYFRKLGSTLVLYGMASVVCLLYKRFYVHMDFTLWEGILMIFSFHASSYAWYVEMYIGLFLLCPFLNLMYNGLETKKQRTILVLVLIFITSGPSVFNTLDLTAPSMSEVLSSTNYTKLVPDFWMFLYPVQFYMIGMHLKTYGWQLSLRRNLLYIVLATAFFSTYNYLRQYGLPFSFFSPWLGRSSVQNLLISVLVFVFCLHLPLEGIPRWFGAVVRKLSQLSFLIYLVSSVSDDFLYPYLWFWVPNMTDRLNYYLVVAPLSLLVSALGAQLLLWLYQLCSRLFRRLTAAIPVSP